MRFFWFLFGQRKKVSLLFMGLLACCCHFVFFLLFSFYAVTVYVIYTTNVILLLSCKQYSLQLLLSFRFQIMQKWLLSCQMPHCLSNITRKVTSKGGLPAFILSAFAFRIRIFLRHAFYNTSCVHTVCIFCSCGNRCLVFTKLVLCLSPK